MSITQVYTPVLGTKLDDNLVGSNRSEVFAGYAGNDKMTGWNGTDVMYGGSGNDHISGNGGNDLLFGNGSPKLVDMANLRIGVDYNASVTFLNEGAGFRNSLGMYKIDENGNIKDVEILFANSSAEGSGGDLIRGVSSVNIDLQADDQLGFFVVSNGYGTSSLNRELLSDANAHFEFRTADGRPGNVDGGEPLILWHVDSETGEENAIKSRYGNDIFHSTAKSSDNFSLNSDNFDHVVGQVNTVTGQLYMGFEDLKHGGDKDFDDVSFVLDLGAANVGILTPTPNKPSNVMDDDYISGGTGQDEIYGMSGNDELHGGDADDKLWGNSGNDKLYGDSGNDTLRAGKGDDFISDGTGNDVVYGNSGDDTFLVGQGSDKIVGGSGYDLVDFSQASNSVKVNLHAHKSSGLGNDTLDGIEAAIGSNYSDKFKGDKRDNNFSGNDGDDWFRGLGGEDVFTGGEGADTYFWREKDVVDNAGNSKGVDRITDFNLIEDKLDFSALAIGPAVDSVEDVMFTETDDGTLLSVKGRHTQQFNDVVLIEDQFGLDYQKMVDDGTLIL